MMVLKMPIIGYFMKKINTDFLSASTTEITLETRMRIGLLYCLSPMFENAFTTFFRFVDQTGIRMHNVHNLHTLDSLIPVPSGQRT